MESKYGHLVKELPFREDSAEPFKHSFLLDKSFLGFDDLSLRYGLCEKPGIIVEETDGLHTHDYDQLLLFYSSDLDDMLELQAEVEMPMGEEGERYLFSIPTAVSIPGGTPHSPAIIRKLNRNVHFMALSCSPECRATPMETDLAPGAGPLTNGRSRYYKNVAPIRFFRKHGYFYGSDFCQDSGGIFSVYSGDREQNGFKFTISWQSIRNGHTMSGGGPHVHDFNEILYFLGMNGDDPGYLGGEVEFFYGEEMESHIITRSAVTILPKGLPHAPITFKTPERPLVFGALSCAGKHH